jgi:ABC-type polysaccharide/polyol phosphate transport system ATPase subunit
MTRETDIPILVNGPIRTYSSGMVACQVFSVATDQILDILIVLNRAPPGVSHS